MRKTLTALLAASVAVTPALADKGGKGNGRGGHHKEAKAERGGGKQFRGRGGDERRLSRDHVQARVDYRPVRVVRADRDWNDNDRSQDRRKFLKERQKERRQFAREARKERREYVREARHDWRNDDVRVERVVHYAPAPRYYDRQVYVPVRYAPPAVRYVQPRTYYAGYDVRPLAYAPAAAIPYAAAAPWSQSVGTGYGYAPYRQDYDAYWPSSYSPLGADYVAQGGGLFGGGQGGVLGALLPVVVQSLFGGGSLGGLGMLGGGLGGLTGLGGMGAGLDVLPLQQAGYADPYGSGDLTSLLLPALLSQGGSLF